MVTMESWMFLSSFEKLRADLLNNSTILSMVHMPYLGKGGTSMGINFGTTATVVRKRRFDWYKGVYCYIRYFETDENGIPLEFPVKNERLSIASASDFKKIPGTPIAYWVSNRIREIFKNKYMLDYATLFQGIITGDNNKFVRYWFELSRQKIALHQKNISEIDLSKSYWLPYNKGGERRKWYGNQEYVVNFRNGGKDFTRGKHQFSNFFLKPCFSWTYISSSSLATRYFPEGFLWDVHGSSVFPNEAENLYYFLALVSSPVGVYVLNVINPTISYQVENVAAIPVVLPAQDVKENISRIEKSKIDLAKTDWDSQEVSWDFAHFSLLRKESDYLTERLKSYCSPNRA